MVDPLFLNVLRKVHTALDPGEVNWAITGSFGFALQGLPVTPKDIDLQTDEAGAYEIERRFTAFVSRPVVFSSNGQIRSHFGALTIDGLKVEIMGDMQKRLEGDVWDDASEWLLHLHFIDVDGMSVPVLALEYEQQAYSKMGRGERAEMLAQWLRDHREEIAE